MVWLAAALVLIFLLWMFPRTTGFILLGVVVIGALGAGYAWFESQQKEALAARVVPAVRYDLGNCEPNLPLFVGFVNNTNKTISSIYFGVTVRRRGYSGQIGYISSQSYDKILAPGEGYGLCHSMPDLSVKPDTTRLEFEVSPKYVTFQ